MKTLPLLYGLLSLTACTSKFDPEEWARNYHREKAALYDQNPSSNLEEKLHGNLRFGIVLEDMQPKFLKK
ncbi:hypothetical protein EXS74_02190 [Candidatus Woesearchaeota archaeon]|nr:hypothetical protein [Candidatus Woesearchaeota archaeon]